MFALNVLYSKKIQSAQWDAEMLNFEDGGGSVGSKLHGDSELRSLSHFTKKDGGVHECSHVGGRIKIQSSS